MTEYQLGGALHYCLSGDHKCRLVAMRPALWHFAAACIEKHMSMFSYFQPKRKNTKENQRIHISWQPVAVQLLRERLVNDNFLPFPLPVFSSFLCTMFRRLHVRYFSTGYDDDGGDDDDT